MSQERNIAETEQLQQAPRRKRPVGVCFHFTTWRALAAVAVLLASTVIYIMNGPLFRDAETGVYLADAFFWAHVGTALFSALLCFLEIRLPGPARRVIGWVFTLLLPLGAFFAVDLINGTRILTFSPLRFFANYLCYLTVFALLYALFRRAWVAALIGGGLFLAFGMINYFVIQFRGQPILPLDLHSVHTAAAVAGGYKFALTRPMVLSLDGLLCAVMLCLRLASGKEGKKAPSRRSKAVERLCALAVSAVLAVLIFPCDMLSAMGISIWPWNQKVSSELTGVMAGFFGNVQFMMVDKPEDYSPERAAELAQQLETMEEPEPLGKPGQNPTVIVVMNESMTDFQKVGDVEFTQDNLPFLHSLQQSDNVIWGTAYASVYGGNTCNSEYEFLTGNTTAFFPAGSIPYQQYVTHEQTALPSILKSYGYSCTAIHPGNRKAWHRDKAYTHLDFDEFISARNFDVERKKVHNLTSDESHYDQVIYEYEHRDKSIPQFLFTVTIQNHGGFESDLVDTTVQVKGHEGKWPQTEQYLSLTKLSDEALADFIGYFEKQKDPVVVLFFGDHWPNLETDFLTELLGTDANDPEFEELMRERQVPFVIWANYPLESQEIESVSLNYLSGLLLRAAGLEGTGYTKFLESLRREIPVINALGTVDWEGNLCKIGEETPYDWLLNEYAILQYNNAFGGEDKAEEAFTR